MKNSIIKEEKRKLILNYAKRIYEQENRFISKREIRSVFHLEIYNYFENIFEMYQQLNIDVPLGYSPREYAISKIIDFVRLKSKEGLYPTKTEIEKELGVHIYTYFQNIEDVYKKSNIYFKLYRMRASMLNGRLNSREQDFNNRKAILTFIQKNVSKGHYPGITNIQKTLNLAFYHYFNDIIEAYNSANVKYERPSPILLGKQKERVLTLIVKELLFRMDYKIKRGSIESEVNFNRYADITIEDKKGNGFLVEIKAYRQDYGITIREFNQLNDYLKKENISQGIFITTSNTPKCPLKNIQFINGNKLLKLLSTYNLKEYISAIHWIQESRVNSNEKEEYHNRMRQKITDYVQNKAVFPSKKNIEKTFKIDIRTYFGEGEPMQKIKNIIK